MVTPSTLNPKPIQGYRDWAGAIYGFGVVGFYGFGLTFVG